ncbi:beta-glucuronidase-like isoform X2 [Mizuhopecten yessoensis]|nr:beta-glucuronidase-like isoform X2 [Mizuhopecten yessoensis]
MPVPSSYNDITQDKSLRDFIGWVWYDREFYVPSSWLGQRVILRLESVRYYSIVWVNGVQVAEHEMGHLPFEGNIGPVAQFGGHNRVTVAVNNTLTPYTLPPGKIQHKSGPGYPKDYFVQILQFGFFNYAGIDRPVKLYTTPSTYIDDITIHTDISGNNGILSWSIVPGGLCNPNVKLCKVAVEILSKKGMTVALSADLQGQVKVENVQAWWPFSMNESSPAYLYTMQVTLKSENTTDVYRLPFGFRTVSLSNNGILINKRSFYCHGVGKHEDYDVRGKGVDNAMVVRDFSLLRWLGVNCFRTSHYPYADEIMDQADQLGIVVIDECPAIGLTEPVNYNNQTLYLHKKSMMELVRRDKNRPSVILWSIGNEPLSSYAGAGPHFGEVIKVTKQLDPYRPLTFASNNVNPHTDHVMSQVDVVCVNIYFGWYSENGHTEVIEYGVEDVIGALHTYYNKPVMVSEYGAESLPGLHVSPSFSYSEEYQNDLLAAHHKAFDKIKGKTLAGEMIWNFADFLIDQEVR